MFALSSPWLSPRGPHAAGSHVSCFLPLASFIRCENLGYPFATIIDLLSPPRGAPPVDTPAGALKWSAVRRWLALRDRPELEERRNAACRGTGAGQRLRAMSLQGSQAAAASERARRLASIEAVRCCVTRVVPSHVQLHGGRHEGLCGVWFLVDAGWGSKLADTPEW